MVAGGHVWLLGDAWLQGGMCGWGGMCGCGGAYMVAGGRGVHGIRRDTVNERAVRILLECILVGWIFPFMVKYLCT